MHNKDKLIYFNNNVLEILRHQSNDLLSFLSELDDQCKVLELFKTWPDEIKIKIVEKHLNL